LCHKELSLTVGDNKGVVNEKYKKGVLDLMAQKSP